MAPTTAPDLLYHYTSRAAVIGILERGFAYMPCDRLLLAAFFGRNRPFMGDPQNYGMVCFTEAPPKQARAVRKKGDHFLAMRAEWARDKGVRKVRYFGPYDTWRLRRQFMAALKEMTAMIAYPDDEGLKLAYRNKAFAALLGASKYAELLDLYEYSQTWRDRGQREWRITQKLPFYDLPSGQLPSPEGWGMLHYLRFNADDVAFIGCPTARAEEVRNALPMFARSIQIQEFS